MAEWIDLGSEAELPPGQGFAHYFEDGRELAVFNVGGEVHCTDNMCLHVKGPLGQGHLDGETVTCPWHGWQFNVRTGECLDVPGRRLGLHPARFHGGRVQVHCEPDGSVPGGTGVG